MQLGLGLLPFSVAQTDASWDGGVWGCDTSSLTAMDFLHFRAPLTTLPISRFSF